MTAVQMGLTIAVCTAATMITRFLPCGVLFQGSAAAGDGVVSGPGAARRHLWYADRLLPEKRHPLCGHRGIPEAIALLVTVGLHKWKHETLLSVAGGTLCYVLLVQLVF